ncbi:MULTISPECIES: hypothetical protein [Bacillus]|uniref:hypothetical protein n=1 Tax=Bacillus TaxID=1386 RepID=UPI001581B823|nr:hypothetical protein [Bacillus glycinifermentans]MBU8787609.1 hypothetical protein [Bacillus glycinifermentans]NUJ17850.1 hypothetical protein [Bacillus glycinifermentans]
MILNTQLCCGLYENGGKRAGFARVISDFVRFGWVCNVFIWPFSGEALAEALSAKAWGVCLMMAADDEPGYENGRKQIRKRKGVRPSL